MADASARRNAFRERAANAKFNWEFFDAHTSLIPELEYSESHVTKTHGRSLNSGELGCYSSHYSLWRNLLQDDADSYIIFEDDVIVDWMFVNLLVEKIGELGDIDYLRLYYKRPVKSIKRAFPFISRDCSLIELYGRAYGTQGYFINKPGAKRLIDACRIVERPIDDQMDRSWAHGVRNLALFPCPVIEENVPSMIGINRFAQNGPTKMTKIILERDRRAARNAYWWAFLGSWLATKRDGVGLPFFKKGGQAIGS